MDSKRAQLVLVGEPKSYVANYLQQLDQKQFTWLAVNLTDIDSLESSADLTVFQSVNDIERFYIDHPHSKIKTAFLSQDEIEIFSCKKHFQQTAIINKLDAASIQEAMHSLQPTQTANKKAQPVAADPYSVKLLKLAKKVAASDVSVLISGESGVGKEVLANYIHDHSFRKGKVFTAINCAAVPENMLEASFFGYEKGAFTGAVSRHIGKFEEANGGTLLLDEISEMPLALQAKLLRVIQERELERLGGRELIKVNVRIIATTNRMLQREVVKGTFRSDLYYRLNVFPIHWVPLRKRPLDIVPMAQYLIEHHSQKNQRKIPTLSDEAKAFLLAHDWPGNAREMDNIIQRALVMQNGDVLTIEDFIMDDNLVHAELQETPVQSSSVTEVDKLSSAQLKAKIKEVWQESADSVVIENEKSASLVSEKQSD